MGDAGATAQHACSCLNGVGEGFLPRKGVGASSLDVQCVCAGIFWDVECFGVCRVGLLDAHGVATSRRGVATGGATCLAIILVQGGVVDIVPNVVRNGFLVDVHSLGDGFRLVSGVDGLHPIGGILSRMCPSKPAL